MRCAENMLQLQPFCEAVHLEVAACLGLELSTAVGMLSAEPGRSSEAAAALLANHALPSCSIGATTLALAAATECDNGPLKLNVAYTQGCWVWRAPVGFSTHTLLCNVCQRLAAVVWMCVVNSRPSHPSTAQRCSMCLPASPGPAVCPAHMQSAQ